MLEAARLAVGFIQGRRRGDLSGDPQLALALVKAIEIIGEAAGGVSEETVRRYPQLPWEKMRGMRNRLIHAYFDQFGDRLGHGGEEPAGADWAA